MITTMFTYEMHDFIYYALRDRFEVCKERGRASDEEDNIFDNFAELVASSWVRSDDTPSSIVDNRCINWSSGTYREFIENYENPDLQELLEMDENEREKDDLNRIEERIIEEGGDYDRSSLYFHI